MYLRTWKKGDKFYASVVESIRTGNHVNQKTIVYLGKVEENQIPYLKVAYASDKPKLVYKDGTVYEG